MLPLVSWNIPKFELNPYDLIIGNPAYWRGAYVWEHSRKVLAFLSKFHYVKLRQKGLGWQPYSGVAPKCLPYIMTLLQDQYIWAQKRGWPFAEPPSPNGDLGVWISLPVNKMQVVGFNYMLSKAFAQAFINNFTSPKSQNVQQVWGPATHRLEMRLF